MLTLISIGPKTAKCWARFHVHPRNRDVQSSDLGLGSRVDQLDFDTYGFLFFFGSNQLSNRPKNLCFEFPYQTQHKRRTCSKYNGEHTLKHETRCSHLSLPRRNSRKMRVLLVPPHPISNPQPLSATAPHNS